jgi:hypothetical protein
MIVAFSVYCDYLTSKIRQAARAFAIEKIERRMFLQYSVLGQAPYSTTASGYTRKRAS